MVYEGKLDDTISMQVLCAFIDAVSLSGTASGATKSICAMSEVQISRRTDDNRRAANCASNLQDSLGLLDTAPLIACIDASTTLFYVPLHVIDVSFTRCATFATLMRLMSADARLHQPWSTVILRRFLRPPVIPNIPTWSSLTSGASMVALPYQLQLPS